MTRNSITFYYRVIGIVVFDTKQSHENETLPRFGALNALEFMRRSNTGKHDPHLKFKFLDPRNVPLQFNQMLALRVRTQLIRAANKSRS